MFNLDLRALPNTTLFTTSKVRLGPHPGVRAQAEYFGERINEYNLKVTPGGRIRPGMMFNINDVPFAGPIVFSRTEQGQVDTNTNTARANGLPEGQDPSERAGNVEGDAQMEVDLQGSDNTGYANGVDVTSGHTGLGAQLADNGLIPGIADAPGLGEETERGNESHLPAGPQLMSDDPFLIMIGDNGRDPSYIIDTEYVIQAAIANRVDSHNQRAREEDEKRYLNQRFVISTGLPICFNNPIAPEEGHMDDATNPTIPQGGENEAQAEPESAAGVEQRPVIQENEIDQMIQQVDSSSMEKSSEEWPTEEWIPSEESDTVDSSTDPIHEGGGGVLQASEPRSGQNHLMDGTIGSISDDHWDILSCRALKDYKAQGDTTSENVFKNKVTISDDWLDRTCRMPGTKELSYKFGISMTGKGACKRKAYSNPKLELQDYGTNPMDGHKGRK